MPNPYRNSRGQFASKGAGGGGVGRKRKGGRTLPGSIKRSTSKVGKTARTQNRNSIQLANRELFKNQRQVGSDRTRNRSAVRMGGATKNRRALPNSTPKAWSSSARNSIGRGVRRVETQRGNKMLAANGGSKLTRQTMMELRGVPRSTAKRVVNAPSAKRRMAGTQSKTMLRGRTSVYGKWGPRRNRVTGVTKPVALAHNYTSTGFSTSNRGRGLRKGGTWEERRRRDAVRRNSLFFNKAMATNRRNASRITDEKPKGFISSAFFIPYKPKQGTKLRGSLQVPLPKPKRRSRKK